MSPSKRHPVALLRSVVGWSGFGALAVWVSARALGTPLNHDAGWWLHVGQSMLDGEVLYRDIIEVNPPMAAYLTTGPLWTRSATGIPLQLSWSLWVLVLLFGVTAWTMALARRPGDSSSDLPVIGSSVLVSAGLLAGGDLGQREHLMFILVLPYALVLWRRLAGHHVGIFHAVTAGLTAGIGIALKPHFLLFALMLEVAGWSGSAGDGKTGTMPLRAPERGALVAVLAVYGLWVLLGGRYLPLLAMTADLYQDFASADRRRLAFGIPTLAVLLSTLIVIRNRTEITLLAGFFFAIALAGLILTVFQGKGWSYHFFPVLAGLAGGTMLVAFDFARRVRQGPRSARQGGAGLILVTVSLVLLLTSIRVLSQQGEAEERRAALFEQVAYVSETQQSGSFLVLSAFVSRCFPLANYVDLRWASPFPSLWWVRARSVPGTRGFPRPNTTAPKMVDPTEVALSRMLVRRFLVHRPVTVFVDEARDAAFGGAAFPYLAYLGQLEGFREAWESYTRKGQVGPFAVWVREAG